MPWPDWVIADVPALARYVSVEALDDIALPNTDRYTQPDPSGKAPRSIAADVYEGIRALRLQYMHGPWRREGFGGEAEPKQRVRYPAWVRRGSGGTCLDLAILYATALMRAQIRPYIALIYTDRYAQQGILGEREGHAFVVADLRSPFTMQQYAVDRPRELQAVLTPDGESGELSIQASQPWPDYLLAVDPMCATRKFPLNQDTISDEPMDFGAATAKAREYVGDAYQDGGGIQLCDIATAQARSDKDLQPFGRPGDASTPAIWTRLPEMPAFTDYPSRREERQAALDSHGRIVIHGEPGFGKSMLAYARAWVADGGYGWFLNAADRAALQSELARAENDQQERGFRQPLEKADRTPFSEVAVRRLEDSDAPWVLVIDNANGEPGDIARLLPRKLSDKQAIIVTTTNSAWLDFWPEPFATHVSLGPLTSGDMPDVPEALRSRVSGSPLFYEAARAAVDSGAEVTGDQGSDAELVWRLAEDILAREPGAIDLAHLVAWAPPVALPASQFAEFSEITRGRDGDPARLGRLLQRAGLARFLNRPVPAVLMHRLISQRIRQDQRLIQIGSQEPLPAPVALMAASSGQKLMTDLGDDESFTELEKNLGAQRPSSVPPRSWGLAVYGIARAGEIRGRSEQSSALFEKAIDCLDPALDRPQLSECWNGRARFLKDHPPTDPGDMKEALDAALSWAVRGQELAEAAARDSAPGGEQQLWNHVRAERAHAMRALILQKQARSITDPRKRKEALSRSLEMLRESEDNRRKYLGQLKEEDSPDLDRSRFNHGGVSISLAKLSHGGQAQEYLRNARDAYETAKAIRVRRHGPGIALPAVASCDNGIALACYYGALLEASPMPDQEDSAGPVSPQMRMELLRQATAAAIDALRDRTSLAPADRDDGDAIKSDDLLIKILAVRKLLSAQRKGGGVPLSPAKAEAELAAAEREARAEARDLGGIIAPTTENGAEPEKPR
jgi:hypothetical protein